MKRAVQSVYAVIPTVGNEFYIGFSSLTLHTDIYNKFINPIPFCLVDMKGVRKNEQGGKKFVTLYAIFASFYST